mmetsp:Transcript_82847/g.173464  ORF Transcript_82847/g.173464 Transcript_82847/m.173464 type:complete len:110 (+) Transcript_82847:262-591(+)
MHNSMQHATCKEPTGRQANRELARQRNGTMPKCHCRLCKIVVQRHPCLPGVLQCLQRHKATATITIAVVLLIVIATQLPATMMSAAVRMRLQKSRLEALDGSCKAASTR